MGFLQGVFLESPFWLAIFSFLLFAVVLFARQRWTGLSARYALPVTRPHGRVKVAAHNQLEDCDPLRVARNVAPEELTDIRSFMATYIPSLAAGDIRSDVCLYTMTPDGDFVLGALSGQSNVFTTALAGHLTAEVGIVDLDPVAEGILLTALEHHLHQFVLHPPGGIVLDAEVT